MTGNTLIVYAAREWPLRNTMVTHLRSFERSSRRRCFHWNAELHSAPPRWITNLQFDVIVFHTSFLSWRWTETLFAKVRASAAPLIASSAVKVALPQDEFLRPDLLCAFIDEFGIDVVCSVAPASEWPNIYADLERTDVSFEQILTGYLDDATLERIEAICAATSERTIDIGYRAWGGAAWLGRHGLLKKRIADVVVEAQPRHGLRLDISTDDDQTFYGDAWFRFLASCRWTIGVEGGASILDRDGAIRARTDAYVADHPNATFEEIEAACFPGVDGNLALFAISPRHLEACATRTGQILVEGDYSGALRAGEHYIPVRPDLSDLDEALAQATDETRARLVDNAYRDIVASGRFTYQRLVDDVERAALGRAADEPVRRDVKASLALLVNRIADRRDLLSIAWQATRRERIVGPFQRRFPGARQRRAAVERRAVAIATAVLPKSLFDRLQRANAARLNRNR